MDSDIRVIADRLERFEKEISLRLEELLGRISEARDDSREMMKEASAAIRMATDPVTGYVPRSEILIMKSEAERARADLRASIDRLDTAYRDALGKQNDALNLRIDNAFDRIDKMRIWVIGTFVSLVVAGSAILGLTHH